ncbi:hypothetical protein BS17DRAFT_816710 [Gyrodon lividus]|nr:hypothetical protein BS17DRAFT_816710 [Gyrodon lividus]
MTPVPSATQWRAPAASKRALLTHGNTSSSHTWGTIGQALAKVGYLVPAPKTLGFGNRRSDDSRLDTFTEDLRPYFADGILIPADKRTAVVLVNPVLESDEETRKDLHRGDPKCEERRSAYGGAPYLDMSGCDFKGRGSVHGAG